MKKICFVVAIPGSAQSFLRDHISKLQEKYEVHLAGNFPKDYDGSSYFNGVIYHQIPIQRKILIWYDLKALFALYCLFKIEKFQCIHSVTPKAGLLTACAGWLARVPNRIHIYTGQVWATCTGFKRILLKTMDKIIALLDTLLLVDGESQRQFLIKEGVLKENNSMVPAHGSIAGIKLDRFVISEEVRNAERNKLGFSGNDVCFIFLGRLNHDKGIGELFEAFNRLVAERPNAKLLFYGSDEEDYDAKAESFCNIKRNKNYFFPGRTSKPFDALQAGDVFVLPTWREGFGVSVLEAQALSLPVITSDAYGVVDASVEGVTGLRCKVNDPEGLYHCMKQYYDNPDMRIAHGKAGRERVLKFFNNDVVSGAWMEIYKRLLDK